MPNIIKFKRKNTTGSPLASVLQEGEACYNLIDKTIHIKNSDGSLTKFVAAPKIYRISSILNNSSSTVAVKITDFQCNLEAGKKYKIEMLGAYLTAALTTGIKLSINCTQLVPGAIHFGYYFGSVSASAAATELKVPITNIQGQSITTTGVSAVSTPHPVGFVIFLECTTSGIFEVEFFSEVNGSQVTLSPISFMIVEEL